MLGWEVPESLGRDIVPCLLCGQKGKDKQNKEWREKVEAAKIGPGPMITKASCPLG